MKKSITYTPSPTCEQFLLDERPQTFIVGPVGSGKTTAILFKIVTRAMAQAPSPRDGIRRTRWVIVRNTLQQLMDTTLKSWLQWFPDGEAGQWVSGSKTFWLRFGDVEAEVLFRPLDTPDDVRRVLSLEVTGAILDEFVEIPREIVDAVEGRCGRYPAAIDGGPTWWGMWGATNPGNEDNWWFDYLYSPWEDDFNNQAKEAKLGYYEQPSGFSPHAENLDMLPGKAGYYKNLSVGKTEAWIKQFIEVQWGYSLKGKPVYRTFDPNIHVAKRPLLYNPYLPLIIGFDPGFVWSAAVLGQPDPHGRLLVLEEVIGHQMGARRFCSEKLRPTLAMRYPNPQLLIIGDPAGQASSMTDEKSVFKILREEMGVPVRPAPSNLLEPRLQAVEDYLSRLTDHGAALLLDPERCPTLIRGFKSGYRYAVNNKGAQADKPEKNEYSHPHDAMQYLCMAAKGEQARDARRRSASAIGFHNPSNPYVY